MHARIPSLLITDDDRCLRETLRDAFQPRGFRTLLASDGCEALTIVQREPVDLVLLDMHMPRLTGLETIRRLQRMDVAVPCILISADLDAALAEEARRANAYSVLAKPVRFAEVLGTVSRALREAYGWRVEIEGS